MMALSSSIRFCVDEEYIGDSVIIYKTLQEILSLSTGYVAKIIAKIIAEYASTQYLGCMECGQLFGYIECYKDYKEEDGVQALKDNNDNVRYYLNDGKADEMYDEYDEYDEYELYDNDDNEMEILCIPCAVTWKCSVCSLQTFPTDFDDLSLWQCNICKLMICDICCIYIKTKTICKICHYHNQ